ncbi:MAG: InlB B-repeat-containing protein [Clostridiales Family XIII bacterium]|jgi:uncharacterized repeat protein (TIGR02543 family)|nr:InlB B-repeat-containing protein [Clostridiales Family XIII bacterium]
MLFCRKQERARRLLSALLILALALALFFPPLGVGATGASYAASDVDAQTALDGANAWIKAKALEPQNGFVGGEWAVLALARSGAVVPAGYYEGYVGRVEKMVKDSPSAKLSQTKSTENERLILALSALGVDATSFGGKDIVAPLTQDFAWVTNQGINGAIFALIALDTKPYFTDNDAIRSQIITYILGREEATYGWSLDGSGTQKADLTAMALQALAPYSTGKRTVSSPAAADIQIAVNRALTYLSSLQGAGGGIGGSSESCAQTIVAMCALGMDPNSSALFVMGDGKTLIDGLLSYRDAPSGGFRHVMGGSDDGMATEQAAYALAAYIRFKAGKSSLYDMSDMNSAAVPPLVTEDERKEEEKKLEEANELAVYPVAFDANGGRFGSAKNAPKKKFLTQTEGRKYALPEAPKRAKYSFTGWYTKKSGGAEVAAKTVVKEKRAHTIWAHWAVTKKSVTYHANGGKLAAGGKKAKAVKKAAAYGKRYALPKVPTRAGYKFKGWYTKKSGGVKVTKTTKVAFAPAKQTLWARWSKRA